MPTLVGNRTPIPLFQYYDQVTAMTELSRRNVYKPNKQTI